MIPNLLIINPLPYKILKPNIMKANNEKINQQYNSWPIVKTIIILFGFHLGSLISALAEEPLSSGVIEGQVMSTSGVFLNNAKVSIEGTNRLTFTNNEGRFRFSNVPLGPSTILAHSIGFTAKTAEVEVLAGSVVRQDFELRLADSVLSEEIVTMKEFNVTDKEWSAQMAALNEQRIAPNIKSVLSADEFGNLGEGNLEDFLSLVPGMTLEMSGNHAVGFSVRGVGSENVLVTIDGSKIPSALSDDSRSVNPRPIQMANIDRIEITKVPTPDMPANAVGGQVNVITKSGFDRLKPELSIKAYTLFNSDFDPPPASRPDIDASVFQPAVDVSYVGPVTSTLGVSISASTNTRYTNQYVENVPWNEVTGVLRRHDIQPEGHRAIEKTNGAVGFDWRLTPKDSIHVGFQYFDYTENDSDQRMAINFGNSATGDSTYVQGSDAADGLVDARFANAIIIESETKMFNFRYRHRGEVWDIDGQISASASYLQDHNDDKGFFGDVRSRLSGLIISGDGIGSKPGQLGPTQITVTDQDGDPVDIFDPSNYVISRAFAAAREVSAYKKQAKLDIKRYFGAENRFTLMFGASVEEDEKDLNRESKSWNFVAGTSSDDRRVGNYDIIAPIEYNVIEYPGDENLRIISPIQLWDLYEQNPEYFELNEVGAFTARINGSKNLVERVSAAYIRGDWKFFDDRFWIVAGLRYERTEDEGQGPLRDPGAVFARDANGDFVLDDMGEMIPLATDPMEIAKLEYQRRAATASNTYDHFFPSVNTTFNITDNILLRAAYARTIGRPNLNFILPGLTFSSPGATNPRITVVNTALTPWIADNFDLSLESYLIKGGFGSISLFKRDIDNVFGSTTVEATSELLAELDLTDEFIDYDISTRRNVGSAEIKGFEISYRQDLEVIFPWLRGTQVFINATTAKHSTSDDSADFSDDYPDVINWGVNYVRPRFAIRLNWAHTKERLRGVQRAGSTIRPETRSFLPDRTVLSGNLEIRLTKHLTFEASARNILNEPRLSGTRSTFSEPSDYIRGQQKYGTDVTMGIRARF